MAPDQAPEPGRFYQVTVKDCCVGGTFTAELTRTDDDSFVFDNGVTIGGLGVTLEEVPGPGTGELADYDPRAGRSGQDDWGRD